MKTFTFSAAACALLISGGLLAAPPQGAPAATTAATPPCMQDSRMGQGHCPGMQGGMGNKPCPGMQGRMMNSPCPGMRNSAGPMAAAPAAGSKPALAGSTNPAVYGWQLMTPEERTAYRNKMRAAKTPEEKAKIRAEHHKEMQQRAKDRGMTLPEPPPG